MTKKIFAWAALLMASATFIACSGDDDVAEQPQQPANPTGTYTMTIEASKDGEATTRALTLSGKTLNATWATSENVYVKKGSTWATGSLQPQTDGATATLKGTLSGISIEADDELTLQFPRSGELDYTGQVGTLDDIAAKYDYATATVKVASISATGNINPKAATTTFTNQQAIVKFTLIDKADGTTPLSATQLIFSNGTNSYTVTPASGTSEIYLALPGFSEQTVSLAATVGSDTYIYSKSGVTFANGQYYEITVKMTKAIPLTMEAVSSGTIVVTNPKSGMQYSKNGGAKTAVTSDAISVTTGDKVAFYGNGTSITAYGASSASSSTRIGGTAQVKAYGNIMSLVDETGFATATTLSSNYAFTSLFYQNTHLTDASGLLLPATTMSAYCYRNMFNGCTSLTAAPTLPATTLAAGCYYDMFNGCTALTAAPALPATMLTMECYRAMFLGCTSLTSAPELPATTLANYCYYQMFNGCTNLTSPPALPAYCYYQMFKGCTSLTAAPALPATTLASSCYHYMFSNCTALKSAPELPAQTLADHCYCLMFNGCTSLSAAPELPAMALAEYCYYQMFKGCTSLTAAPALPATTLALSCYNLMFRNCTSLTSAPALPATTLVNYCYTGMFYGCTSLTVVLALSATTLSDHCYEQMFQGCTSLTAAPALPATTLADYCYFCMFQGCTALTSPPALPATTLTYHCYQQMFQGCTALTSAPALPATTLTTCCYQQMFYGCTKLNALTCLATNISATTPTSSWLYGVAATGTFTTPSGTSWTTGASGIPDGWTRMNSN